MSGYATIHQVGSLAWRVAAVFLLAAAVGLVALPSAQGASVPGLPLPTDRALRPAGKLIAAGDFPADAVLVGGGLYVVDNGMSVGSLQAVSPTTLAATTTAPLESVPPSTNGKPTANSGMVAASQDGTTLYLPGAATGELHTFHVVAPGVAPIETVAVNVTGSPDIWGAAATRDGDVLVTETFANNGLGPSTDEGSAVLKVVPSTGQVIAKAKVGREPLDVIDVEIPGEGEQAIVADRESGQLSLLDPTTMHVERTVNVGPQPAGMALTPDGHDLLVSLALDDVVVDLDTETWTVRSTLSVSPVSGLGAAPTSIAIDPTGSTAYVALSADNALAVLHRTGRQPWQEIGQIPTADYPTSVVYDAQTTPPELFVTAGKGTGHQLGEVPGTPVSNLNVRDNFTSGLGLSGDIEAIAVPDTEALATDTNIAAADDTVAPATPGCLPPATLAAIKHVVYVIRENKTFDEEFGDITPYGDPAAVIFGKDITPNTHAIAERSVLLANFYSDEEVSDTGHAAVMGGVANDFLQRITQQSYDLGGAPRQGPELGEDDDSDWSPENFLLDDALARGVNFRDYGEFYRHDQDDDAKAVTPALDAHLVLNFPGFGFNPGVPDTLRVAFWKKQFDADVAHNTFPALEVIYLPEDHTTEGLGVPIGPEAGQPTRQVADSDLATGQLIAALSASPYWDSTAVFLTEDDPQSGTDHVDDHRTIGLVVGGRVKHEVSTTHYDSGSMLRTIEEILRLPAMTERDATAEPMTALFSKTPDPVDDRPYHVITPDPLTGLSTVSSAQIHSYAESVAGPNANIADLPSLTQEMIQWYAVKGVPFKQPTLQPAPAWAYSSPVRPAASAPGSCAAVPKDAPASRKAVAPIGFVAAGTVTGGLSRRRRRP